MTRRGDSFCITAAFVIKATQSRPTANFRRADFRFGQFPRFSTYDRHFESHFQSFNSALVDSAECTLRRALVEENAVLNCCGAAVSDDRRVLPDSADDRDNVISRLLSRLFAAMLKEDIHDRDRIPYSSPFPEHRMRRWRDVLVSRRVRFLRTRNLYVCIVETDAIFSRVSQCGFCFDRNALSFGKDRASRTSRSRGFIII